MKSAIKYSAEVSAAIAASKPIVALGSTIISHGLPRPSNLAVAIECESIIRQHGAVPARLRPDGVIHIGLEVGELEAIANRDDISKASIRIWQSSLRRAKARQQRWRQLRTSLR